MGEGGAVLTDKPNLQLMIESFRDWGRDCWCDPGKDNTCGKRFDWQLGTLPCGYDHKYTYSHIGYNLKATDMQAALGASQIDKLPHFIERRKENFRYLRAALKPLEDCLLLPEATPGSDPAWFGFPIGVGRMRLSARGAGARAGGEKNRNAAFVCRESVAPACVRRCEYRIVGELTNTDFAMNNVFWIGVYPGLTRPMLDYVSQTILDFAAKAKTGTGAAGSEKRLLDVTAEFSSELPVLP